MFWLRIFLDEGREMKYFTPGELEACRTRVQMSFRFSQTCRTSVARFVGAVGTGSSGSSDALLRVGGASLSWPPEHRTRGRP